MATFDSLPVETLEDICSVLLDDKLTLSSLALVNKSIGHVAACALWQRIHLTYDLRESLRTGGTVYSKAVQLPARGLATNNAYTVGNWFRADTTVDNTWRFLNISKTLPFLLPRIRHLTLIGSIHAHSQSVENTKLFLHALELCENIEHLEIDCGFGANHPSTWSAWADVPPQTQFLHLRKLMIIGSLQPTLLFLSRAPNLRQLVITITRAVNFMIECPISHVSKIRTLKILQREVGRCHQLQPPFWNYVGSHLHHLWVPRHLLTPQFSPPLSVGKLTLHTATSDSTATIQSAQWQKQIQELVLEYVLTQEQPLDSKTVYLFPNLVTLEYRGAAQLLAASRDSIMVILGCSTEPTKLERFTWRLKDNVADCAKRDWALWTDTAKGAAEIHTLLLSKYGQVLVDSHALGP